MLEDPLNSVSIESLSVVARSMPGKFTISESSTAIVKLILEWQFIHAGPV